MDALGIDFGTSGARAIALNSTQASVIAQSSYQFQNAKETADPKIWEQVLYQLIEAIAPQIRAQIHRIAINGTSATMLLCDQQRPAAERSADV